MFAYSTFTFGFLLMISRDQGLGFIPYGEKVMTLILEIMKTQIVESTSCNTLLTLELP